MTKPELYAAAGAAVLAVYLISRYSNAAQVGSDIGGAAVNLVDGVLSGAVIATGEIMGIPRTNLTQGQIDFANGDYWNASFNMPAGDFIGAVWKKITN